METLTSDFIRELMKSRGRLQPNRVRQAASVTLLLIRLQSA